MTELFGLWLALGLLCFAGFCVTVTFRGITENAPLELRAAHWIGRGVFLVAALALFLACSKGLVLMATWAVH